jgi:SAM-dependent methyltransferase
MKWRIAVKIKEILYPFLGKSQIFSSSDYWEKRYLNGGNSGSGSYSQLAQYKANVINGIIQRFAIESVIDFGCGDGNIISLLNLPNYLGFDVSKSAIKRCQLIYKDDPKKEFRIYSDYSEEKAELSMSLDVIYHLVEDNIFSDYMDRLFQSSNKYVLIYSTNYEHRVANHMRHRCFTDYVARFFPQWQLIEQIRNEIKPSMHFYFFKIS